MTELPPVMEPVSFKDRSTGLKIFGVILTGLGALCGLMTLLLILGGLMMSHSSANALPPIYTSGPPSMVLPVLIYSVLTIVQIWLGVGAFLAKRWARTLIMILSWSGIYIGVLMAVLFGFFAKNFTLPPGGPPNAAAIQAVGMAFMAVFFGIFFIALPASMAWFFTKQDVKLTCEERHPTPSWTDRCPPTVLYMTLWQLFSAATMSVLPLTYHGTVPQFGVIFSGLPGAAICLVEAGLLAVSAVLYFRLSPAGWWLMLGMMVVLLASGLMNTMFLDFPGLYQAMGYSGPELDKLLQFNFMQGGFGVAFILVSLGPGFALLAWTRRYFSGLSPKYT